MDTDLIIPYTLVFFSPLKIQMRKSSTITHLYKKIETRRGCCSQYQATTYWQSKHVYSNFLATTLIVKAIEKMNSLKDMTPKTAISCLFSRKANYPG